VSRPSALHVHILIDSLTWGGAEGLLADLATCAGPHGLELSIGHLFPESSLAPRLREAGLDPVAVGAGRLSSPGTIAQVRRHLAAIGPDLLHTHLQYSDLLGGLAARKLGIPALSTLHVLDRRDSRRERGRAVLTGLARRRWHRRVIAVSEHLRSEYLALGADSPEHVVTMHNGISVRSASGARDRVRAELGLGEQDFVVTMVGVLRAGKGHELAVAAVEELRGRIPSARLLVVGDGPARGEVATLAARLGDAVVQAGYRGDVMAVLDASDVLIHPSRADAFPTVLLEALAAGVPIAASRVGGIPEIVEDGKTGLLVAPPLTGSAFAGSLVRLFDEPGLRQALAERGRERFEAEFTADRWATRLRALYDEILERSRRASATVRRAAGRA
jgi:glycosyltransferase involved in cell wall biosynthesis